jgi:hypothetical protein
VTKEEYERLFVSAIERAIRIADIQVGFTVPREAQIILFDKKNKGDTVSVETALDSLYLDHEKSYYVIDVGVKEIYPTYIKVFVRVSGHTPVNYDAVWKSPDGDILFKQVLPQVKISTT